MRFLSNFGCKIILVCSNNFGISKIPTHCLKEALVTWPLSASGLFTAYPIRLPLTLSHLNFNINCYTDIWPPMIFQTKLVFLHHHDVLWAMVRINSLNTFFSLAWLLRVFGQKLLNGVAIGGWLLTISLLKIYYLG